MKKMAVVLAGAIIAALLTDIYNPFIFDKLLLTIKGYGTGAQGKAVSTIQQGLNREVLCHG